ncbi:hypothetical protein [Aquimarina sp. 433]
MIRYIIIFSVVIISLGCAITSKSDINDLNSNVNNSSTEQQTSSESKWIDQEIGSKLLLTNFPEFWSYSNSESQDKNKYNLLLEEIEKSNQINKSESNLNNFMYETKNYFIPFYDSFYSPEKEKELPDFDLIKSFKFNQKIIISIYKKENYSQSHGILKRLDLVVHDNNKELVDGLNICLVGSGDQYAYTNNFYIKDGIINLRNFYIYDGESSSSEIFKYRVLDSGSIVPYFEQKEGEFTSKSEKGELKNNTKTGKMD